MCRRFALTSTPDLVRAAFRYGERPEFPARYNIAPTQPIALVAARPFSEARERGFLLARWGFLPGFAKDPATFPLLVNARAEGLADRPSFQAAFKRRRCLAPADGFYVFRKVGRGRPSEPYLIQARDGAPFGIAALYETYLDPNGSEIDTACLITIGANALLAPVSERMPVLIPRAAFSAWLDEATPLGEALALLQPAAEGALRMMPVSPAVRHADAEGSALQAPVDTIR